MANVHRFLAALLLVHRAQAWWTSPQDITQTSSNIKGGQITLKGTHLQILLPNLSVAVSNFPADGKSPVGMMPTFLEIMQSSLGFSYTLVSTSQVCPIYCCMFNCSAAGDPYSVRARVYACLRGWTRAPAQQAGRPEPARPSLLCHVHVHGCVLDPCPPVIVRVPCMRVWHSFELFDVLDAEHARIICCTVR